MTSDSSFSFNPSEDQRIRVGGNTYRKHAEVVALQGLEHIGDASLQAPVDEDAVAEVIQQDDPQGVHVACIRDTKRSNQRLLCHEATSHFWRVLTFQKLKVVGGQTTEGLVGGGEDGVGTFLL